MDIENVSVAADKQVVRRRGCTKVKVALGMLGGTTLLSILAVILVTVGYVNPALERLAATEAALAKDRIDADNTTFVKHLFDNEFKVAHHNKAENETSKAGRRQLTRFLLNQPDPEFQCEDNVNTMTTEFIKQFDGQWRSECKEKCIEHGCTVYVHNRWGQCFLKKGVITESPPEASWHGKQSCFLRPKELDYAGLTWPVVAPSAIHLDLRGSWLGASQHLRGSVSVGPNTHTHGAHPWVNPAYERLGNGFGDDFNWLGAQVLIKLEYYNYYYGWQNIYSWRVNLWELVEDTESCDNSKPWQVSYVPSAAGLTVCVDSVMGNLRFGGIVTVYNINVNFNGKLTLPIKWGLAPFTGAGATPHPLPADYPASEICPVSPPNARISRTGLGGVEFEGAGWCNERDYATKKRANGGWLECRKWCQDDDDCTYFSFQHDGSNYCSLTRAETCSLNINRYPWNSYSLTSHYNYCWELGIAMPKRSCLNGDLKSCALK